VLGAYSLSIQAVGGSRTWAASECCLHSDPDRDRRFIGSATVSMSGRIASLSAAWSACRESRLGLAWQFRTHMRRDSRRSFTVEIKSTDRRHATIIPRRSAPPAVTSPWFSLVVSPEPPTPVPEQRRILPNLIVPEAAEIKIELMPGADETRVKLPRGRPRKTAPAPCASFEDLAEAAPAFPSSVAAVPLVAVDHAVAAPTPALRSLKIRTGPVLAPGERWKRRLGHWAR
jgi:hypothetical protein